jgi:replicative DNA helicase
MEDMITAKTKGKPIASHLNALQTPPSFNSKNIGLYTGDLDWLNTLRDLNTTTEPVIPFDIPKLDSVIQGVRRKTINIPLAGTNIGKTLMLCHFAAAYMRRGLKVLYLTREMTEVLIQNRIHANLLEIDLERDSTLRIPPSARLPENCGSLVVKSFPGLVSHAGHFRSFLAELKTNLNFAPDVVLVDYLALCASERLQVGAGTPQYAVIGSISKELRALAQQTNTVLWTASQANREGLGKGMLQRLR